MKRHDMAMFFCKRDEETLAKVWFVGNLKLSIKVSIASNQFIL